MLGSSTLSLVQVVSLAWYCYEMCAMFVWTLTASTRSFQDLKLFWRVLSAVRAQTREVTDADKMSFCVLMPSSKWLILFSGWWTCQAFVCLKKDSAGWNELIPTKSRDYFSLCSSLNWKWHRVVRQMRWLFDTVKVGGLKNMILKSGWDLSTRIQRFLCTWTHGLLIQHDSHTAWCKQYK